MNKRNLTVVAALLLLSTAPGCSGMKNFLLGRGAQCGLCNRVGSPLNLLPQRPAAPYGVMPYGPPAAVAPSADCGCNGYAGGTFNEFPSGNVYSGGDDTCGHYETAYGGTDCNCGSHSGGHAYADPYSGGEIIGSSVIPRAGEYIPGEGTVVPGSITPDSVVPGYIPGTTLQDNFDTRSNRIITEQLPAGVQYAP